MRFEAKHQYFKALASSLGNFIHIALSLATRHQMLQCYLFSSNEALSHELTLPSTGRLVAFASLSIEIQKCLCYAKSKIWSVKEATVAGCVYSVGAVIVVDFTSDGDPVFIKISHLFLQHDGHLDIVGKLMLPIEFSKKYYAYNVEDSGWAHCHPGSEVDCVLLSAYELNEGIFISLPYYIPPWSKN
jgi:hypothetical protein